MRHYLDHNATTPVDIRVRAEMEPYLSGGGNPSSLHAEGRRVRAAIDDARDRVADALGVKPGEIIFTSGGTESNNLAVRGLSLAAVQAGAARHLITSQVEHHAVLETCQQLEHEGWQVTYLPVDNAGHLDRDALTQALQSHPRPALVTLMTANNETGVRFPWREIAQQCAQAGVAFHSDAVQSGGKEPLTLSDCPITALSLAAHKFYGPTGCGLLFLRLGTPLHRLMHGGSQENQRRPGTENVASIVGCAAALEWAQEGQNEETARLFPLIETLWHQLADLPGIQRNGDPHQRLANTLNVSFAGLDGEELLIGLDLAGLALSSGSACLVGAVQPSHVLRAMGVPESVAKATVRFSLGHSNLEQDLPDITRRVREVVLAQQTAHGIGS